MSIEKKIPDEEKTPAQVALVSYMRAASEARWCAGWATGLHLDLRGDTTYEWLVEQSGGWFTYSDGYNEFKLKDEDIIPEEDYR